ncbi:MAG TPA: copper resistance protein CopC [Actinomycetota bacterium]|jgi:copper transport protein
MGARRVTTAAILALGAALAVVWAAPSASAHALLKSSDPANGAQLAKSPAQILMTFTEAPDPHLSLATLLDSTGHVVSGASKAQAVPGQPQELRVALSRPLPDGVYTVNWRTVSLVDGHVVGGAFAFGIGEAPSAAATTATSAAGSAPGPPVLAVVGRWAFVWGVALLIGAAAAGLFVFGGSLPAGARWLLLGGFVLAVAGLVVESLVERAQIGISLGGFLSSSVGRGYVRQGVALLLTGAAGLAAILRPGSAALWALGVTGALTMLTHALGGHADAQSSIRVLNLGAEWIHLVAVGVWIGGLVWLLFGLRGAAGDRVSAVARFSFMATIAVIAVVLSGVARAIQELGSIGNLIHTSWGVTLLVKSGIFAVLAVFAITNRFRIVPGLKAGSERIGTLRRTVGAEVVLAVGVIAAAALLSDLAPASFVSAAQHRNAAPSSVVVTGSDFATTVRVQLTVTPGMVGSNRFSARVTNYDTGAPVPAQGVRLQFSLPSQPNVGSSLLSLSNAGGGVWTGQGTNLSIDGAWSVDVTVQEASGGVDVPLTVRTRLPAEKITVSAQPGEPTLYTISLPGGRSLQTYVDPGKEGTNTVHFTFFQTNGNEQPVASASAYAIAPSGADETLKLIRFSAGHFAANAALNVGRWTFRITGRTSDGTILTGYFMQSIG